MSNQQKELFSNDYMTLFSDGTLGLSDGVGYVDTLSKEETQILFEAMKSYFVDVVESKNEIINNQKVNTEGLLA